MSDSAIKAHRTVSRVTDILEYVAEDPGVPLNKIATTLDAPKSSVFALVKGLVSTGYLLEVGDGYSLGPAVGSLLRSSGQPVLAEIAAPFLSELRDEFGETVTLATQIGESMIYVASAESAQPIRYSAPLRVRRPLYPPSAGKVFLAWWSVKRRTAYLREMIDDETQLAAAITELENVRKLGIAFNRGETLPDVSAVARPILIRNQVAAVIAIAGPTARMGVTLQNAPVALTAATSQIAKRLG